MTPRPRSLLRRVLRWFLVALLLLAALIVAALAVLHTDWARDKVRAKVEAELQKRIRGRVTIGDLDGDLLGDVTLREISIVDERGRRLIEIASLRLTFELTPLLDRHFHAGVVEVAGLEVASRRGPDGRPLLADLFIEQLDTGGP